MQKCLYSVVATSLRFHNITGACTLWAYPFAFTGMRCLEVKGITPDGCERPIVNPDEEGGARGMNPEKQGIKVDPSQFRPGCSFLLPLIVGNLLRAKATK